ncbi:hypothetical protein RF11_09951 [Thelohanellus kitauei]|uniref:Kelch domain-containing protein 10 n=1 Tax=Thelohanellus kitauei TaxID=669202 RepID=A0A0C2MXW2_THEKT|nr:hypothetical protein RF11_09951 [Thelohanellus kitauei]
MNLRVEPREPEPRSHHCMACVREFLIIYGGWSDLSRIVFKELWTYNTLSGFWKRYQPPLETIKCTFACSICSDNNQVYIFGGSYLPDGDIPTNSLISFNV